MLILHTWPTQNARKISVMLEECGLEYEIRPVNIMANEQFTDEFKRLNPNSKIPTLVDTDVLDDEGRPVAIFETGAILLHLAEKTGRFLPANPVARIRAVSWLFWQCSGMGPVFGNFAHFASAMAPDRSALNAYLAKTGAAEAHPYPIERFAKEGLRLLSVLNQQLSNERFIADELSIADFASYPWVESAWQGFKFLNTNLERDCSHVVRWMSALSERPGVARGMAKLAWGVTL